MRHWKRIKKPQKAMKRLEDFDFQNKRILVRLDFNVPLDKNGEISDDFRIKKTLPTIEYLLEKKAKVILISHLENSGGERKNPSLRPIAQKLKELSGREVKFLNETIGKKIIREIEKTPVSNMILLENLRFYPGEKENDENFARELSKLADFYVNEAFSVCHRAHASVVGVPKFLPSCAGFLLGKEIEILSDIFKDPPRPLVAIIGGVKIESKIKTISRLLAKADHLLLGSKIGEIILATKGILIRPFYLNTNTEEEVRKINLTNPKIHLPIDGAFSLSNLTEEYFRKGALGVLRKEEEVFDVGPETINLFKEIIKEAKEILWNGPLGMFEDERFEAGTKEIVGAIAENHSAFKIAGGGETISAITKYGFLDKFDHISTGGGAMLEFLAGETLPGIEALK